MDGQEQLAGHCKRKQPDVLDYKKSKQRSVTWTPEEEDKLVKLVALHKSYNNHVAAERLPAAAWRQVAEAMGSRTTKQCKEKYWNNLREGIVKGDWSFTEEFVLAKAHSQLGNKWRRIAEYLPHRDENTIKNHWNGTLKAKRGTRSKTFLKVYITSTTSCAHSPFEDAIAKWQQTVQQGRDLLPKLAEFEVDLDHFKNGAPAPAPQQPPATTTSEDDDEVASHGLDILATSAAVAADTKGAAPAKPQDVQEQTSVEREAGGAASVQSKRPRVSQESTVTVVPHCSPPAGNATEVTPVPSPQPVVVASGPQPAASVWQPPRCVSGPLCEVAPNLPNPHASAFTPVGNLLTFPQPMSAPNSAFPSCVVQLSHVNGVMPSYGHQISNVCNVMSSYEHQMMGSFQMSSGLPHLTPPAAITPAFPGIEQQQYHPELIKLMSLCKQQAASSQPGYDAVPGPTIQQPGLHASNVMMSRSGSGTGPLQLQSGGSIDASNNSTHTDPGATLSANLGQPISTLPNMNDAMTCLSRMYPALPSPSPMLSMMPGLMCNPAAPVNSMPGALMGAANQLVPFPCLVWVNTNNVLQTAP